MGEKSWDARGKGNRETVGSERGRDGWTRKRRRDRGARQKSSGVVVLAGRDGIGRKQQFPLSGAGWAVIMRNKLPL